VLLFFLPKTIVFCFSGEVVGREGVIWTSGFLVPGKNEGKLSLYFTDVDPIEGPFNIASLDVSLLDRF